MDYIKVTYKDGEVWRARLDKEDGRYCADGVVYCSNSNSESSSYMLNPCEWLNTSIDELKKERGTKVEEISEEDYWNFANNLMTKHFDEEIEELKKKLKQKKKEKQDFLLSSKRSPI